MWRRAWKNEGSLTQWRRLASFGPENAEGRIFAVGGFSLSLSLSHSRTTFSLYQCLKANPSHGHTRVNSLNDSVQRHCRLGTRTRRRCLAQAEPSLEAYQPMRRCTKKINTISRTYRLRPRSPNQSKISNRARRRNNRRYSLRHRTPYSKMHFLSVCKGENICLLIHGASNTDGL